MDGTQAGKNTKPRWTALLSGLLGGAWTIAGLVALSEAGTRALGVTLLAGGIIILPPVATALRALLPPLRPLWAPPVLAFVVFFAGAVISGAKTDPSDNATLGSGIAQAPAAPRQSIKTMTPEAEAAKYVSDVETILLPVVEEPSGKRPYDEAEMWGRMGDIEFWSRRVGDGRALVLNADEKKVLARFEESLKAKQATEFPKLRAAYRKHARDTLWSKDVDVYGSGKTIEFVAGAFAARQNMIDALDPIRKDLTRLRFTEARFRWIRDGEGARFPIEAAGDGEIVVESP